MRNYYGLGLYYLPQPSASADNTNLCLNNSSYPTGPDSYITRFACGGAKNYSYVMSNNTKHCKVRGFTLNFENSQILKF